MIGSNIDGKYLVRSLIGEGGMGSVFEAEHTGTGRRVAVKVINSGDLTKDQQILSRFEREARAAGAIETQYITQVLDAGIDRESGLPFMAMEYLEGEDLQRMLKRVGPIAPPLALRITAQACLGLRKAHEANVVHRDIKPHNLFLARRDAGQVLVKLLDFGIAKVKMDQAQSRDGADLTKTGNLLGSPLYVSPEQARGKRHIDHRTDIYSLGAVMYQMLAGRTPFEHATALGELILMVCTEAPAPLQDHAPWVPPEVAQICHRCIQKNADERYPTAQALFDDVCALLPPGWNIDQDMLISLAESQRREVQPRAAIADPSTYDSGRYEAQTSGLASVRPPPPPHDGASTTGPVMGPAEAGAGRAGAGGVTTTAALVVAGVAVVGIGIGADAFSRPQAEPPAPGAAPSTTLNPPTPPTARP
ncbi:MAG: serine/threonine-protein kinase [Myxococcota bacterium]